MKTSWLVWLPLSGAIDDHQAKEAPTEPGFLYVRVFYKQETPNGVVKTKKR
jgi:hypothetical protein